MQFPGRYAGEARPIVTYGSDPVLHRLCAPVTVFDKALKRLVLDMAASMYAAEGVGLAANQIGVDARIFVIDCPDADGEPVEGHVINPVLTLPPAPYLLDEGPEGCLSVPGPHIELARAASAEVRGLDVHGRPVHIAATGMAARCLQHEVGHLDGQVYVDLLDEVDRDRLLTEAGLTGARRV